MLRAPRPRPVAAPARASLARLGFRLAVLAVALHFLVSSSLLYLLGINYNTPGGNPLVKFHPATYTVALAAWAMARGRGGAAAETARLLRDAPALVVFIGAMAACGLFALISTGMTGAAIFGENYISAGLLAYVVDASEARERRLLARVVLALCVFNVAVAVGEAATQTHVVPLHIGEVQFVGGRGEFRATAGYDHPLTGAFATMMGLLLLPGLRLRAPVAAVCFGALCVGLLGFGGRTALAVGAVALAAVATGTVARGLAARRLDPKLLAAVLLAAVALPVAAYLILTYTPIGERLIARLYFDDSAEVRNIQWLVLGKLSLYNALFGMPEDRIPLLAFGLGLSGPFTDIENPWLLIFLKLGVVGSAIYLAGLIPFLARLWRASAVWGRVLLLCGLVVASSSNSFGRKSNLLFLITAFVTASAGYAPRAARPGRAPVAAPAAAPAAHARDVAWGIPRTAWASPGRPHHPTSSETDMQPTLPAPPRGSTGRLLAASLRHDLPRMLLVGALVVLGACAAALTVRPLYEANSTLLVLLGTEYTYRPAAGENISVTNALDREQILRTEVEILRSPDLHRRVIREITVERLYPELLEPPGGLGRIKAAAMEAVDKLRAGAGVPAGPQRAIDPVEEALVLMEANLSLQAARAGNSIEMGFAHPDPKIAAEMLHRLKDAYLARRRDLYLNREAESVNRQVAALRARLESADAELARFKTGRSITNYQVRREILLQQQGAVESNLRAARIEISQETARLAQLDEELQKLPREIMQSREAEVDQRLAPLRVSIEALRARAVELRARYRGESDVLTEVQRQIASLEAELARKRGDQSSGAYRMIQNPVLLQAQQDRMRAQVALQAAKARAARDEAQLADVSTGLAEIGQHEQRLTQLERARGSLEDNYRAAVKVRDERLVSEGVQADRQASVRVLQEPVVPSLPRPTRKLIVAAGLVLGAFAAVGAGLISHFFRRVYLLPEALELETGLRVLACVPNAPRFAKHSLALRPDRSPAPAP